MTMPDATHAYPQPGTEDTVPRTEPAPLRSLPDRPWLLIAAAVGGILVPALVTWLLFGPSGPFYRDWGFSGMVEYLNETIGEGSHAGEASWYLLVLVLAVPAALGMVARSGHWIWIAPLTFPAADLVLFAAAVLTGTPHPYFPRVSGLAMILMLYGVPALAAAAVGVLVGKGVERLVRS